MVKGLALSTALSWEQACGRKTMALIVEFVLLAIPNNLNRHVLAPWALKGAPIVARPVGLDTSEPHVGVT
jgi:hypothetical protein